MRKITILLFFSFLLYGCKATDEEIQPDTEKKVTHSNSDVATDSNENSNGFYDYHSDTLHIQIQPVIKPKLKYWVSTIKVNKASQVKSEFAGGSFSSKTEETSEIAKNNKAVFAVNGGGIQYKSRSTVIRNGKVYRSGFAPLEVRKNGTLFIGDGRRTTDDMLKQGVLHTFDFGPELLINGKVPSFKDQDWFTTVRAPRTAIGQRKPYEYIIITVDGRSSESSGMTFAELVKVFQSKGVKWAYNLDGGGSTTLYYLDNILNHPSDGEERPISDILYFTE